MIPFRHLNALFFMPASMKRIAGNAAQNHSFWTAHLSIMIDLQYVILF